MYDQPRSPDHCTFTVIQSNHLSYYSRVIKARMILLDLHRTAVFCTASFYIILGIFVIAVYHFACLSVLVFIITDSAQTAEKMQWVKNTTKLWQMQELQQLVVLAMKLSVLMRNSNNPTRLKRLNLEWQSANRLPQAEVVRTVSCFVLRYFFYHS